MPWTLEFSNIHRVIRVIPTSAQWLSKCDVTSFTETLSIPYFDNQFIDDKPSHWYIQFSRWSSKKKINFPYGNLWLCIDQYKAEKHYAWKNCKIVLKNISDFVIWWSIHHNRSIYKSRVTWHDKASLWVDMTMFHFKAT